jgi:hypothetical protein
MSEEKGKKKKEEPRGWHVPAYLPVPGGITEERARAVAAGLRTPCDPVKEDD